MTSSLGLVLAVLVGVGAGALFFEGLWQTVSRAVVSSKRVPLLAMSFVIRLALVGMALSLLARGSALRLGACMLGFLLGRALIIRIHREARNGAN